MESFFSKFTRQSKETKITVPKKATLIQVNNQFEDLTLTKEFLEFLNTRVKLNLETLANGGWDDESQARELVGYLRACEEIRAKYENLYKSLYNR